ncbi:MAG: hypothetical protein DRH06_10145, partial [Deltaproteobacteria bacterium]
TARDDSGTGNDTSAAGTVTITVTGSNETLPGGSTGNDDSTTDSGSNDDNSGGGTTDNPGFDQPENEVEEDTTTPLEPFISAGGEQLPLYDREDTGQTEEILYLTDDEGGDGETAEREKLNDFIYFDDTLYQEISAGRHLNFNSGINRNANDFNTSNEIDFTDNNLQRIVEQGDYDLLRAEIDEAFSAEQHAESIRTNIITATTATFTVGLVTYLLRAGSLVASMISTLPLWRGFDPIVIVARKKKKKDEPETPDATETGSETLFDSEPE